MFFFWGEYFWREIFSSVRVIFVVGVLKRVLEIFVLGRSRKKKWIKILFLFLFCFRLVVEEIWFFLWSFCEYCLLKF